jgi:hypothetical protein
MHGMDIHSRRAWRSHSSAADSNDCRSCSGRAGTIIVAAGPPVGLAGRPRTWQRSKPWRAHSDAVQARSRASMRPSRCLQAGSRTGGGCAAGVLGDRMGPGQQRRAGVGELPGPLDQRVAVGSALGPPRAGRHVRRLARAATPFGVIASSAASASVAYGQVSETSRPCARRPAAAVGKERTRGRQRVLQPHPWTACAKRLSISSARNPV